MIDNLPVVNYEKSGGGRSAIERCPTGAIVWFDADKGPVQGRSAHKVIRVSARRASST